MTDTAIPPNLIDAAALAMVHAREPDGTSATYTTAATAVLATALPLHPDIATNTALRADRDDARKAVIDLTGALNAACADAETWRHRAERAEKALAAATADKVRLAHIQWLADYTRHIGADPVICPDGTARATYRWLAAELADRLDLPPDATPPKDDPCRNCGQSLSATDRLRELIAAHSKCPRRPIKDVGLARRKDATHPA